MAGDLVYGQLLSIKVYRQEQAELELVRKKLAHQEAVRERKEAEEALEKLKKEGKEIEEKLYGELCSRVVKLLDIEEVNYSMGGVRKREVNQKQTVQKAEESEKKVASSLEGARSALVVAARQASRFNELSLEMAEVRSREREQREELEMEESIRYSRDRDEWGHSEEQEDL